MGHTKRRATIGRPRGNGRPHSQRCHRSVRSMFTSFVVVCASDRKYWRLYYCVVLTILNVIPNGITCIYKILEINLSVRPY